MWYLLLSEGFPDYKRPRVKTRLELFATKAAADEALSWAKLLFIYDHLEEDKIVVEEKDGEDYFDISNVAESSLANQWLTSDEVIDVIQRETTGYIDPFFKAQIAEAVIGKSVKL